MKLNKTVIEIVNNCIDYKYFRDEYYFQNEITVSDDNIHIVVWCEKLAHQIDVYIKNANTDDMHDYNIEIYHNDDVLLYVVTDLRINKLASIMNSEINVILEMNL